jgi:hypothetical protein
MLKPTYTGVALLLLAAHCGGSEWNFAGNTPGGSAGTGGSATGGADASHKGGSSSGGSTLSEPASGGSEGEPVSSGGADDASGGAATTQGGEGSADAGGADTGAGGRANDSNSVSGLVVGNWDQPLEGVLISIDGVTTATDANGAFEIADVAPTYRIIVLQSEAHHAQIFDGLSTRHPKFLGDSTLPSVSTTLSGTVSYSDGSMIAAEQRGLAAFSANGAQRANASALLHSGGSYSMGVDWAGSALAGRISAMTWTIDATGLPRRYDGYATKDATLTGETAADRAAMTANLQLSTVSTRTLNGTLTLPTDYIATLDYHVGPLTPIPNAKPGARFAYQVPIGTNDLCWLALQANRAIASGNEWSALRRVVTDSTASLELVVPRAPSLVTPVDEAASIDRDTVFQWIPHESLISVVRFTIGDFTLEVNTTQTSIQLPDLSAFGVALSASSPSSWEVRSLNQASSMDEAAEFAYSTTEFLARVGAADVSRSVPRSFTYASAK